MGYYLLEVADAGGFDALALCLLSFFLQTEVHGQRFLLGLLFGFDGGLQCGGQLDVAQENVLDGQAALIELLADLIVNLLGYHFAFARVESVGGVGGGCFANGGAEGGLDHDVFVVGANLLENVGSVVGIEMVNERGIQTHHQTFAGRYAGRFFQGLRLDGQFVIGLQGIDEVNALAQGATGLHFAEKREDADVAGAYFCHGTEQQNH